jgi:hypothetical protein
MFLSSDFDKPRFFKPANVPAPKKYRAASYAMERVGGEMKPVLRFVGTDLGLILNATIRHALAEKLGDNMLEWPGHVIVLFPAMTLFDGRSVPCVRARVPAQPPAPAPVAAPLNPPNGNGGNGAHASNGNGAAYQAPSEWPMHDASHDDELELDELDNQIAYASESAKLSGEEFDDDVAF